MVPCLWTAPARSAVNRPLATLEPYGQWTVEAPSTDSTVHWRRMSLTALRVHTANQGLAIVAASAHRSDCMHWRNGSQ